eukprot:3974441-Heterocapsa_arctica.AAC.1
MEPSPAAIASLMSSLSATVSLASFEHTHTQVRWKTVSWCSLHRGQRVSTSYPASLALACVHVAPHTTAFKKALP